MTQDNIYLHHFAIMAPTPVIEQTMAFYRDVLGIAPGPRPEFGIPGYWLYSGENPIIHLIAKEDHRSQGGGYFHHIALRCHDLEDMVETLKKAEIPYSRMDIKQVKQTQLTLHDPAGNMIELNFGDIDPQE